MGDAFHQAAIAQEAPGGVVDDGVARTVELRRQCLLGDRHAHGIGQPLAQRAGGGLDTRRITVFRVTGGLGMQLAEVLQIFKAQLVAREVQQGVEQHGAVAVGQHEAVTVGPVRVGRVVLEVVVPEHFSDVGHAHGGAGVARLGLLNGVHGKCTDGVGQVKTGRHAVAPRLRASRVGQ